MNYKNINKIVVHIYVKKINFIFIQIVLTLFFDYGYDSHIPSRHRLYIR